MKNLFILTFLFAICTTKGYAGDLHGQTSTECPMMKHQNERNNPKLNMSQIKLKTKRTKSTSQ